MNNKVFWCFHSLRNIEDILSLIKNNKIGKVESIILSRMVEGSKLLDIPIVVTEQYPQEFSLKSSFIQRINVVFEFLLFLENHNYMPLWPKITK